MNDTIEHPEESLQIIKSMIAKTRQSFHHNSFYFLLWGILMFVAGLSEYWLLKTEYPLHWIGWPVLSVLGGVASAIYGFRQERKIGGETFADKMIGYVWLTYGISLICMIFTAILVNVNPGILVLLLTGLPTFLTGAILRHKPLLFGGVVFWAAGLACLLVAPIYVPLIFSGAILLGYLIPGFTLLKSERARNV